MAVDTNTQKEPNHDTTWSRCTMVHACNSEQELQYKTPTTTFACCDKEMQEKIHTSDNLM